MQRRIFGIENEYGVTCTFEGQRRLSPDEVARYLFRRVVSWGRSSNVFLRNGARLYLDVGSHPEYATPECDSLLSLVTHDKAGERILEGLLIDAEKRLNDEGIAGDIYLFKNNTDSAGNSYGCHENFLVARHGEFSRMADVLIPFLVTRQLICGAGKVLQTPRGAVYCLSQRAEHIWEGVSSATTRSRPIINTRDEPHADAERYRRLHVIVGDSNMNESTTLLKVGSADLVLRMMEQGITFKDLTLENPIRAIREISHDLTGSRQVKLANGRLASAGRDPAGVLREGPDLRRRHRLGPGHRAGARPVGPHPQGGRVRRPEPDRPRDRLGHQVPAAGALPGPLRPAAVLAADRPARPDLPRHPPRPRPVLPAGQPRRGQPGDLATWRCSRPRACRRRPPGPSCAASSSSAPRRPGGTSRWTGSTSS